MSHCHHIEQQGACNPPPYRKIFECSAAPTLVPHPRYVFRCFDQPFQSGPLPHQRMCMPIQPARKSTAAACTLDTIVRSQEGTDASYAVTIEAWVPEQQGCRRRKLETGDGVLHNLARRGKAIYIFLCEAAMLAKLQLARSLLLFS